MQKIPLDGLRVEIKRIFNCFKFVPLLTILSIILPSYLGTHSTYAYALHPVQYVNNVKQDDKGSIDIASKELDPERVQELKDLYDLDSDPPANHGITGDFGFSISENTNMYTLVTRFIKLLLKLIQP
ncbi:hypothetical protein [Paenibacillus agilis]|uniref:Uncharacterized protein n=1 Tax=Paenibacillus agilis TaxID=3020863 RepID=A0A559IKF3_9BACL|nr:hypothetical protein [Paenibacillus agilis]TVX88111.1 hypothetical protein FPZ44_19575 [Paenibacillus agilis]